MEHIKKGELAVFIVTYNRTAALNRSIRQYLETIPFTVPIIVISNHTECHIDEDLRSKVDVIFNRLRPNESRGYLSRNWNQCFQLGLPKYKWLLCSQDDVVIKPGWFNIIQQTPYDFYLAPLGDTRFLMNREAFRAVGWFDEHFNGIGYQDHDYIQRVLSLIPEKASVVDTFYTAPNHQKISHHSVGIENFWLQPEEDGFSRKEQRTGLMHPYLFQLFLDKWGFFPETKIIGLHPDRLPDEIDWYPYIGGKYDYLKITNPQYQRHQPIRASSTIHLVAKEGVRVPYTRYLGLLTIPEWNSGVQKQIQFLNDFLRNLNQTHPNHLGIILTTSSPMEELKALANTSDCLSHFSDPENVWRIVLQNYVDFYLILETVSERFKSHKPTFQTDAFRNMAWEDVQKQFANTKKNEGSSPFHKNVIKYIPAKELMKEITQRVRHKFLGGF